MAIKIGYVLVSNRSAPLASTRISVSNMLPYLRKSGFEPLILFEPQAVDEQPNVSGLTNQAARRGVDLVYFQKVSGASVKAEIRALSKHGMKTIYGVCDYIDNQMAQITDATIVVTDYLKGCYHTSLREKIFVVHDGIEQPDRYKATYDSVTNGRRDKIRAVLVTSESLYKLPILEPLPKFLEVIVIGRYPQIKGGFRKLKDAYWSYVSNTNRQNFASFLYSTVTSKFMKVNWNIRTVYDFMMNSDVGIIPVNTESSCDSLNQLPFWSLKSENRLTMKMGSGLPVVASPVPSYESIVHQGQNGYIAVSRDQWIECLEELLDPHKREIVGKLARQSVIDTYSSGEQARKLIAVFNHLLEQRVRPNSGNADCRESVVGGRSQNQAN